MVYDGDIASETFLAYLLAFFYTITPSKNVSSAYYQVQKGAAAYERIEEILYQKNDIIESQGSVKAQALTDKLEFRGVTFRYHNDGPDVLRDINLVVPKGQVVALVGSSGSGKSTLADLMMRFYRPNAGKILYDGEPIQSFELGRFREQFGIVTQEPILFYGTIAENIAFGTENSTPETIREAATLAQADEFIRAMAKGYDSMVGDAGVKLSGGQRQRIALARAILSDPAILILDEATSALDSASEMAVQKAMEHVLKDRTAIVIAHRLSTIQHADRIIVFT